MDRFNTNCKCAYCEQISVEWFVESEHVALGLLRILFLNHSIVKSISQQLVLGISHEMHGCTTKWRCV